MINDGGDMRFLAAYFCTLNRACLDNHTDYCYTECPYHRYVPGWEEIQEIVRDDDRRQQERDK